MTHETADSILEIATRYAEAGISVIPIRLDGSKQPAGPEWTTYQTRTATTAELRRWFDRPNPYGLGAVCGAVSGNLELLDFDDKASGDEWCQMMEDNYPDLLARVTCVRTPRPGLHVWYRVVGTVVPGNQKFAWRPTTEDERQKDPRAKKRALVETRGEGGQGLLPGCPAAAHETGRLYRHIAGPGFEDLVDLTGDERDILHGLARLLDRMPPEDVPEASSSRKASSQKGRPGDDYEAEGESWSGLLGRHGWRLLTERDGVGYWQRPGKGGVGHSATLGYCQGKDGLPLLRVFSSNADPFEDGKTYRKFAVYALLEHAGDFAQAARSLGKAGFGSPPVPDRKTQDKKTPARDPGAEPALVCMADVKAEPVSWLWSARIPTGRLSLLAGPAGLGKSVLTADMAARVSRGTAWPDGPVPRKGSVLLITAEDDPGDTIRPRLDAAGADVRKIHHLAGIRTKNDAGEDLELAWTVRDCDMLRIALERLEDCRLVVIDPVGSYLGGGLDAHRDNEVRSALAPVAKLAAEFDVAVILVAHIRKGASAHADDMVLGSRAFTALARSVLHLGPDDSDKERRLFLPGKCNLARQAPGLAFKIADGPCIEWEPDPVEQRADDHYADAQVRPGPDAEALKEAEDFLRDALRSGPRQTKEIEEEARERYQISERTLNRARRALGVESFKTGKIWYVELKSRVPGVLAFNEREQLGTLGTLDEMPEKQGVFDGEKSSLPSLPSLPGSLAEAESPPGTEVFGPEE